MLDNFEILSRSHYWRNVCKNGLKQSFLQQILGQVIGSAFISASPSLRSPPNKQWTYAVVRPTFESDPQLPNLVCVRILACQDTHVFQATPKITPKVHESYTKAAGCAPEEEASFHRSTWKQLTDSFEGLSQTHKIKPFTIWFIVIPCDSARWSNATLKASTATSMTWGCPGSGDNEPMWTQRRQWASGILWVLCKLTMRW